MPRLTDAQGEAVALLAQVCSDGAFPDSFIDGLCSILRGAMRMGWQIVWATESLKESFGKKYADDATIAITLRMPRGGRQPVKIVESETRTREEDLKGNI